MTHFINPYRFAGIKPLIDILTDLSLTSNLVYTFDAADPNSYSGSGQIFNDVSGGGNDLYLGADGSSSTDDPTYSVNGCFNFDGGDYFQQVSASKLAAVDDCHQNGALFTMFARFYLVGGSYENLFYNNINGSGQNDVGIIWRTTSSDQLELSAFDAPINDYALQAVSTDTLSTGAWHNIAVTIDETTGAGGGFHWADGAILDTAFNATYTTPSTGVATDIPVIGALNNLASPVSNGTKLAAFAMWSGSALTQTNLNNINTQMQRSEG